VQLHSLKTLTFVVAIFFFTSNLSGAFLPIYYKDSGLSMTEIVELLLYTFLIIGLLPIVLLKLVKNFERIISFGIFSTMLFYIALIVVKHPIILGTAYGTSIATFWPSFNLLQFRLSESKVRARTVSFFSSIIPSLASIVGPATGGFVIETFGFTSLFAFSIFLYLVAFIFSIRIPFKSEIQGFALPKEKIFVVFFLSFIFLGLSEAYWLAYPFFVFEISETVLSMGVVLTFSAVLIVAVTFLVNWLSDIKMARVKFAAIGAVLYFIWYFTIAQASTSYEIVALSVISGLAGAFSISWFAHYGDTFRKEYYASILVLMEVGLMIGRIINLVPTYLFISHAQYANYFMLLGIISLFLIPFFVLSQKYKR